MDGTSDAYLVPRRCDMDVDAVAKYLFVLPEGYDNHYRIGSGGHSQQHGPPMT
jgi:hypothetical protein